MESSKLQTTMDEGAVLNLTIKRTLDRFIGNLIVNGSDGIDTLAILDQGGVAGQTYTLTDSTLTWFVGSISFSHTSDGGELNLLLKGANASTFNIQGTIQNGTTTIDGGAGANIFNVGSADGTSTPFGRLIINGGLGSNTVAVAAGTVSDLQLSNVDVLQIIGGTLSQDEGNNLSIQDLLLGTGTLVDGATITASGTVTLGGSLVFDPTDSLLANSYTIINNTGSASVNGIFAGLPEGTVVPVNGIPFVITYHGGDGNDVVLTQPTISGHVWRDTNDNGIQDTDETGLLGVMVTLLDASNNVIATATTNSSGDYGFINLSPGDYSILVTATSDFVFSPEDQGGDDTLDSDVNSSGQTASVTVSAGGEVDNLDAGLVQVAQVTGRVWNDTNGNGLQETGEAGYSGVTVQLLDPTNTVVTTTTADPAGFYSFNGVALGIYSVRFVAPSGYAFTLQNQGSDPTLNSTANSSGQTATFSLTSGSQVSNLDAGLTQVGVVSGRVWLDTNTNGIQDTGETGYAGVTVELFGAGIFGTLVATTTTDSSGFYAFNGVALNVTLLDGTVGDNFDLIHYGSRSGTFTTINPPSLSTVNWDFRYDDPNYPTDLSLWVVS
jgi:SdrD B-like domain